MKGVFGGGGFNKGVFGGWGLLGQQSLSGSLAVNYISIR